MASENQQILCIMVHIDKQAVQKYLKRQGLQQSLIALQKETEVSLSQTSQISLHTYPKQIQFLKKIVLKGDFEETIDFIGTFQSHLQPLEYKQACRKVLKQKLFELIDAPSQQQLRHLFQKQLPRFCSDQEYQSQFTLLTCRKVQEIPGEESWSVLKGRLRLFQHTKAIVESVLYGQDGSFYHTELNALTIDGHEIEFEEILNNFLLAKATGSGSHSYVHNQTVGQSTDQIGQSHYVFQGDKSEVQISQRKNASQANSENNKQSDQFRNQHEMDLSQSNYEKSQVPAYDGTSQGKIDKSNSFNRDTPTESNSTLKANKSNISNSQSRTQKNPSNNHSSHNRPNVYQEEQINEISDEEQKSESGNSQYRRSETQKHPGVSFQTRNKNLSSNSKISAHNFSNYRESSGQNIDPYMEESNNVIYNDQQLNEGTFGQGMIEKELQEMNQQFPEQSLPHEQNFTFSNQSYSQTPSYPLPMGNSMHALQEEKKPKTILKLSTIHDAKAIRTCKFSESGNFFALGTNSSILKLFYVADVYQSAKPKPDLFPIYEIPNLHSKSIFCLDWSRDEEKIVTCSNDLTIKLTEFDQDFMSHQVSVIGRHESCIRMVKFNQGEDRIVSCGDDGLLKIWDMGKNKRFYNIKGHKSGVSAFRFGCEGEEDIIYSVSKDSTVKKWDTRSLECIMTSKQQESEMTFVATKTPRLSVSKKNGNIAFLDKNSLQIDYEVKIHEEEIRSIEALQTSLEDIYLTASFDGHMSIFSEKSIHEPNYFQHNENSEEDKVVYATFLEHHKHKGFASTSTMGLCHLYSYE